MEKFFIIFITYFPWIFSQGNYDVVINVNKKVPLYKLRFTELKLDEVLRSYKIDFYKFDSDSLIQTINLNDLDIIYSDYEGPADSLLDVNFDGYKDLCIVTGIGQLGKNWAYEIFFFNPKTEKFYKDKNFPTIWNIEINDSLKEIYESFSLGCTYCWHWKTFKIKNNKLILIKLDYQDLDRKTKKMHRFIQEYKNGKMVSRKEVKPLL